MVDAFFAAARDGDFERLVAVLHPAVVLRADFGPGRPGTRVVRGVREVAEMARPVPGSVVQPALVNGAAGAVITLKGRPFAITGFTVVDGQIVEIDAIADPARVRDWARSADERCGGLERPHHQVPTGGQPRPRWSPAALAIEHGLELASADTDFARFTELRWVNPLAG